MILEIRICDACKKEHRPAGELLEWGWEVTFQIYKRHYEGKPEISFSDLCPECENKVRMFLKGLGGEG